MLLASSFLGLPTSWKTTLSFLSGLALVFLSVKLTLPKKPSKHLRKKEKVTSVFAENSPISESQSMSNYNPKNQVDIAKPAENTDQPLVK